MPDSRETRRPIARARFLDTQRLGLPVLAFLLTAVGLFLLVASNEGSAAPPLGVDTVVATVAIPAGTATSDLSAQVTVRSVAADARAVGAIESLEELPDGVLISPLVPGQQVLTSSFADDIVDGLGPDLVAVSVRVEAQRWAGPFRLTGSVVTVHQLGESGTRVLAEGVQIIDAPILTEVDPRSEQLISLAVPKAVVGDIIAAAAADELWMVGS
jgi:hypothetical protein